MKFFTEVAGRLEADGIGCPIRSVGRISTWNWTAAYPGVTEIQAGTYAVGDPVELVPGYSPSTMNWYDAYHVVHEDIGVDIWPIIPRRPGPHGISDLG